MTENEKYRHLTRRWGSQYQQLFVGRIHAEVLYREVVGVEPRTPEDVAKGFGLPVEAVLEAIDYCEKNPEILDADRAREEANIKAHGLDKWPHAAKDFKSTYHQNDRVVGQPAPSDAEHLIRALKDNRVFLTKNLNDYIVLHRLIQATGGKHAGILVVRCENDPRRDMKDEEIARAITKLEAAGVPIANEFHILNHWR